VPNSVVVDESSTDKNRYIKMDNTSLYTMIQKAPYALSTDKKWVPEQQATAKAMADNNIYKDGRFDIANFAKLVDEKGSESNVANDEEHKKSSKKKIFKRRLAWTKN
jgi:hypothetical protein